MPISSLVLSVLLLGIAAPTPIRPSATDPAIKTFDDPHLVYSNPEAKPRNELLIFIPGTNGKPGGTNLFCQTAADLGYHVLALAYPSDIPATIVRNEQDPNAFENFRTEIIEGRDLSTFVSVDRTNCIENRLIKLLQYLSKNEPDRGWDQYLTLEGEINWQRIAVSGHSQGGGHAALIATKHLVARAVMTGAPKDFDRVRNRPAAWYRKPATPISRFFAFNHELDRQGCDFEELLRIFKAMGMGEAVNIDKFAAPYRNAHALTTNFEGSPTESARAHSTVIGDAIGPKNKDGTPVFKPVWIYMLTAEEKN
jgi:pimeloyl-ACP methyl ester carboxylesterase